MTVPKDPTLADVVQEVLKRQDAYERQRQSRFGRGAERVTAPIGSLFGRMLPPELVRRGLDAADRVAGLTLPSDLTGHDTSDLAACESAALRVQGWAAGTNAVTGGAAGWFGAAGMTVDIPATISLAARNVRATGLVYGFAEDHADERAFRLMVLEAATARADAGRAETLKNLNTMAGWLATPHGRIVLEKGGEWVADKVVERIARQVGVSLAGRKAGQMVPIVGGAVAAVVNASFQTDVSRAARYAYRQRWLMARRLIPAAAEEEDTA